MKLANLKQLHDQGLSLLWLRPKSKAPIENNWTKAPNKKWGEFHDSYRSGQNVGVRLGFHSKLNDGSYLAVIDCDVKSKNKKHLAEMEATLKELGVDLARAPVVASGRGNGSRHIYVKTKEPVKPRRFKQSTVKVKVSMPSVQASSTDREGLSVDEIRLGMRLRPAWEISIMGDGQQVVLPPSIHPDSGAAYKWVKPFSVKEMPIVKLPEVRSNDLTKSSIGNFKIKNLSTSDLARRGLPQSIIEMIESGDNVSDRSAALLSAALSMCRKGFDDQEILSVLTDTNYWLGNAAYEHTKSDSRRRAAQWILNYTLKKARHELSAARAFEAEAVIDDVLPEKKSEEQTEAIEQDSPLLPDLTEKGKPRPTLRNLVSILQKVIGENGPAYDEFGNRLVFTGDTPYGGKKNEQLSDDDDLNLKVWIAKNYGFEPSKELCFEAHNWIGKQRRFHPVQNWIKSLKWDGIERLDYWLEKGLGARGSPEYVRAVACKTLVAAVSRVFNPGCKFDYVLVLEGYQGKGKSTALNILAGNAWFTDNLGDIHQKDVVDNMTGKWIVEIAELASVKKADVDFLKSFVSRQTDRIRMPYGKRSLDYPRQSIFIGTTNLSEYLQDETGNRRFWPVTMREADFGWLKENREQLFAEAYEEYLRGEPLYHTKEIEELAKIEQSKRFVEDEWRVDVEEYVRANGGREYFTIKEILSNALARDPLSASEWDSKRVGKILRRMDYRMKRVREGGINLRVWVKKASFAPPRTALNRVKSAARGANKTSKFTREMKGN